MATHRDDGLWALSFGWRQRHSGLPRTVYTAGPNEEVTVFLAAGPRRHDHGVTRLVLKESWLPSLSPVQPDSFSLLLLFAY